MYILYRGESRDAFKIYKNSIKVYWVPQLSNILPL
jgi:hypothetical protein